MGYSEADDEIGQLLTEFLADQESRLSEEVYLRYAKVIDLFDFYLDRYYRLDCSRRELDAPARYDGRIRGLLPAVDLVRRFSVFLGDFLIREIKDDAEGLRTARKVIKELDAWLTAKGYVIRNQAARRRASRSERTPYLPGFFQD